MRRNPDSVKIGATVAKPFCDKHRVTYGGCPTVGANVAGAPGAGVAMVRGWGVILFQPEK
jgi:hypothetical protein